MIDLHTHSTCSDGTERPARVVELAAEAGCSALALTDHDNFDGIVDAVDRATQLGVGFIAGCEVSSIYREIPLHLLCYFSSSNDSELGRLLRDVRADRRARNEQIAARLSELGIAITLEDATREAKGNVVGRPHFAALLVRRGDASSMDDAFDRYLKPGAAAYAHREALTAGDVVDAAHASSAVVAVAHPHTTGLDGAQLEEFVVALAELGLDGIESYYASYEPKMRTELAELARRHGLVPTGGSDFHGSYRPASSVGVGTGDLNVPDAIVDELRDRIR